MNRRAFLAASAAGALLPMSAHAQSQALRNAAAYSAERRGVSLYVLQRGQLVFQDYPNEGGPARGWELASGTKSFSGVMAAAAVQDGLLSLDERAADTLNEWRGDALKRRITILQLLSLTSGIEGGRLGRPPTYAEAIAAPATAEPGARFSYGPLPFQIFGEIIRRKTAGDPLEYLTRRILAPLDIRPTGWRRGADGNPHLPSGAQLTARDWAAFGAFVQRGGDGLVDHEALDANFTPSRANPGYGLTWWLLRDGLIPPRPGAGVDVSGALAARFGEISMAAGAGDQRLYLVRDLDLVIVRQASGILRAMREARRVGDNAWSDEDFLGLILGA